MAVKHHHELEVAPPYPSLLTSRSGAEDHPQEQEGEGWPVHPQDAVAVLPVGGELPVLLPSNEEEFKEESGGDKKVPNLILPCFMCT